MRVCTVEEQYEFNGHLIHVWIEDDERGRYKWTYTIDGGLYSDSRDRLLASKVAVLAEGKSVAEAHAARL